MDGTDLGRCSICGYGNYDYEEKYYWCGCNAEKDPDLCNEMFTDLSKRFTRSFLRDE